MKKLILGLISLGMIFSIANAWKIQQVFQGDFKNQQKIHLLCDNGKLLSIVKDNISQLYFYNGNRFSNLNAIAKKNCNQSDNQYIFIKKGSFIFKKIKGKEGIEYFLSSEMAKDFCDLRISLGKKLSYFKLASTSKVKLVKCYSPYKIIVDKYGNYKNTTPNRFKKLKNGEFKEIYINDSYCKIWDGNNYFYVRKQDIQ